MSTDVVLARRSRTSRFHARRLDGHAGRRRRRRRDHGLRRARSRSPRQACASGCTRRARSPAARADGTAASRCAAARRRIRSLAESIGADAHGATLALDGGRARRARRAGRRRVPADRQPPARRRRRGARRARGGVRGAARGRLRGRVARRAPAAARRAVSGRDLPPAGRRPPAGAARPAARRARRGGGRRDPRAHARRVGRGDRSGDRRGRDRRLPERAPRRARGAHRPDARPGDRDGAVPERLFDIPHYGRHGFDYWHQPPDGRIVAGGFRDVSLQDEFTAEEVTTPAVQRALEEFVAALVGRPLRVEHRWAGIFGMVFDFLPGRRPRARPRRAVGRGRLLGPRQRARLRVRAARRARDPGRARPAARPLRAGAAARP